MTIPFRGHLPALDAIRGLAIIVVTLYRFRPKGGTAFDQSLAKVLTLGEHGVDLFFVLSGFLITGILCDTKHKADYFRGFYIRRALRIFPLYYGVLLVTIFLLPMLLRGTTSFFTQEHPYQSWLWLHASNVIMAWEGKWLFGGFDHFWSLAVEEHFYLIWPLVIWLTSRRQALWVCGLCGVVALAFRCGLVVAGHANPAADIFTLCRIDGLAAGAWLALYLRGPHDPNRVRCYGIAATILGLGLGLSALIARKFIGQTSPLLTETLHYTCYTWFSFGFLGFIVLGLCCSTTSRWRHFWHCPAFIAAGKYSYGWYVFQGLISPDFMGLHLADHLNTATGIPGLGSVVQIVVGGGLSLLLAILSWRIFESPILSFKDTLAPRRET